MKRAYYLESCDFLDHCLTLKYPIHEKDQNSYLIIGLHIIELR